MRKGEYISVAAILNIHTKFAKLSVGKNIVTTKQRHNSQEPLLPLLITLSDLPPISKVWVNFETHPKNNFIFKVNDADVYSLVKEEVDFDPSKIETLSVALNVNN